MVENWRNRQGITIFKGNKNQVGGNLGRPRRGKQNF